METSDGGPLPSVPQPFSIQCRREGPKAEVVLGGELDMDDSDRVTLAVRNLLREQVESIEIDMRDLQFIDSSGLESVVLAREEAGAAQVTFKVSGASGAVRRVAGLAGLDDLLR